MPLFEHVDEAKLTETDRAILAFISKNPQEAQSMSAKQLAEVTFSSPAAVVRFCKRAGFESLISLKFELARKIEAGADATDDFDFPRLDQAEDSQAVHSIASMERSAIRETETLLASMNLSPIVDAMEEATGFGIFGMGYSLNASANFYSNMTRLGYHVMRDFDTSRMTSWATCCDATNMAFIVSYSGETESAIFHAKLLGARGIKTVSITTASQNTLAGQTTWNIPVPATERQLFNNRIAPFASGACIEFAFNILYALFFKRNYAKNLKRLTDSLVQQGAQPEYAEGGNIAGIQLSGIPLLRPTDSGELERTRL